MTSEEKKELRECTKKGLIELINNPRYTQNKANQFPAIVGYLARHGLGKTSKEDFLELVYTARNELLAQAGEKHVGKPGQDYGDLGLQGAAAARVKSFLRNPVEAMQNELKALAERKENFEGMDDPDEVQYYVDLKTNADILSTIVRVSGPHEKANYEDRGDMLDVLSRLHKKLPEGDSTVDASLKRINSGFFGTLFRRKSKEYAAFERSFNEFRESGKVYSGNTEDLEKKTTDYLKHLVPGFQYSKDTPREQWLANLPKGKRARAEFALDVLGSLRESKELKPYRENVERAMEGKPIKEIGNPVPAAENLQAQKEFQNEIKELVDPKPQSEEAIVDNEEPKPEPVSLDVK